MTNAEPIKNWKNILWREWYHCDDKDYARRLYHAIATGPARWIHRLLVRGQSRPYAAEVEAALYEVSKTQWGGKYVWAKNLRRLEQAKNKPTPVSELIDDLQDHHWRKRFIARHVLLYRGSEAITSLYALALHPPTFQVGQTAAWLVTSIGKETSERLAQSVDEWICPYCLVHCHIHHLDRPGQVDLNYYGCRHCRRSYGLLHCPAGVIARLDTKPGTLYEQEGDLLYANWSLHRTMFDFDRVEIINATDEDVERFAIQIGNDTDPIRKPRYEQMQCHINPECRLSKNTIRILESIFGSVEIN